jgi:hypothetical protein
MATLQPFSMHLVDVSPEDAVVRESVWSVYGEGDFGDESCDEVDCELSHSKFVIFGIN